MRLNKERSRYSERKGKKCRDEDKVRLGNDDDCRAVMYIRTGRRGRGGAIYTFRLETRKLHTRAAIDFPRITRAAFLFFFFVCLLLATDCFGKRRRNDRAGEGLISCFEKRYSYLYTLQEEF